MRVKSAVDWWIALLVWASNIILAASIIITPVQQRLIVALFSIPTIAFMLYLYFSTYYELQDEHLLCRSGPIRLRIPYEQITQVRLSQNPLSSLALSLKRIEITYNSKSIFGGLVYISPPSREEFMRELLRRMPADRGR